MDGLLHRKAALNPLVQETHDIKEDILVPYGRQALGTRLNPDLRPTVVVDQWLHARLLLETEEREFHERPVILQGDAHKAV